MMYLANTGNWKYLLIAFITALILWYTFNAKEQVERVMDVRLDYKGLPQNLIVTDGQLNRVSVRIRGSLEMLRAFSGRELSYTINLSGLTPGTNTIPLSSIQFSELRAYQVLDITPTRMVLEVDKLKDVKLPVTIKVRPSTFSEAITMEEVHIVPNHVVVKGPRSIVESMHNVTAEVSVNIDEEGRTIREDAPLYAPQSVEVIPHVVNVCFKLGMQRRSVSLQREVLPPEEKKFFTTRPERITTIVSVPQHFLNDPEYLSQIHAKIDTSTIENALEKEHDGIKRRINVTLPPGSRIIKITPDIVTVYRRK